MRSEDVAKIEKSVLDEFELEDEKLAAAKKSQKKIDELKKLFEGCRIFIGRECPRESLTFVIRFEYFSIFFLSFKIQIRRRNFDY